MTVPRQPIPGVPIYRHSKVPFKALFTFPCPGEGCLKAVEPGDRCAFLNDELVCLDCWRAGA